MEGIDHYSPANPFAMEEYQPDIASPWGMDAPAPAQSIEAAAPETQDFGGLAPVEPAPVETDAAPSSEPAPAPASQSGDLRRAVEELAEVVQRVTKSVDESEAERARQAEESASLQRQVGDLETHRAQAEKMLDVILRGAAGAVSHDDLDTIQNMMDALKQDPDRLTVLFTVVQHAGQLANVVTDYAQLRKLAESA